MATEPRLPTPLLVQVTLASAGIIGASRVLTMSRSLFSWDSINFALAMDRFDIARHQPHPPGYLGFVLAGRLFRAVLGDSNRALVSWNILVAIAATILVFVLAWSMAADRKALHGWIAWLILACSAQFWFHAVVAEVYMSEMFFTLLVAYAAHRLLRGGEAWLVGLGAALALAGLFKISGMVFVAPLACYAVVRAPVSRKWRFLLAWLAGLALWVIPLLWVQGPTSYLSLVREQVVSVSRGTHAGSGGSLVSLNRNLRDTAYSLVTGAGLLNVLLVAPYALARGFSLVPGRRTLCFGLLWTGFYLMFFIGIHIGNSSYALPLLPAACLYLASVYGQERRRLVLAAILVTQGVAGSAHFLAVRPFTGEAIGEGLRYSQKSAVQKLLTEANSLMAPTYAAVTSTDSALDRTLESIARNCPGPAGRGVVVVAAEGPLNWRKMMYYLPGAVTVRWPRSGANPFMLAEGRNFTVPEGSDVSVTELCRTLWLLPEGEPALAALSASRALRREGGGGGVLLWTQGAQEVAATGGATLRICRAPGPPDLAKPAPFP